MSANNNKQILYLILGIPLLGVLATTAFYFYITTKGVQLETWNNGILLQPPKQMSEIQPVNAQGKVFEWNREDSHWSFLVVGYGKCEEACQKKMYLVRQIHTALGKDALRLDMTYLNLDAGLDSQTQALFEKEYNHFIQLQADAEKVLPWFAKDTPGLDIIHSANFYVIDPAGWVMMYYTDAQDYKAIIKDMKFLLKNS